jgi:hypothetical protein
MEDEMLKGKELKERAKELNVKGRSKMSVAELQVAVAQAERALSPLSPLPEIDISHDPAAFFDTWEHKPEWFRSGSPAKKRHGNCCATTRVTGKSLSRAQRRTRSRKAATTARLAAARSERK